MFSSVSVGDLLCIFSSSVIYGPFQVQSDYDLLIIAVSCLRRGGISHFSRKTWERFHSIFYSLGFTSVDPDLTTLLGVHRNSYTRGRVE